MTRLSYSKTGEVKSPERGTQKSAGVDMFIPEDFKDTYVFPNQHILIDSKIRVKIPRGFCLQMLNKSSVAFKHGLMLGANLIDEDFQGSIRIHLYNPLSVPVRLEAGMKIVQFVILPAFYPTLDEIDNNKIFAVESERGKGGFGSTGGN